MKKNKQNILKVIEELKVIKDENGDQFFNDKFLEEYFKIKL